MVVVREEASMLARQGKNQDLPIKKRKQDKEATAYTRQTGLPKSDQDRVRAIL